MPAVMEELRRQWNSRQTYKDLENNKENQEATRLDLVACENLCRSYLTEHRARFTHLGEDVVIDADHQAILRPMCFMRFQGCACGERFASVFKIQVHNLKVTFHLRPQIEILL